MTRSKYNHLWQSSVYRWIVEAKCKQLGCDGCTGVPDFFRLGCLEHDIAYRTHRDPVGYPITKKEADKRFRWYMQNNSIFGSFSPVAWVRWLAVKGLGGAAWKGK